MLRELWYWFWQLFTAIVTFRWKYLKYHFTNFWWYLWYGFTYSDIMDTDRYLVALIGNMVSKYEKYTEGAPAGETPAQFHADLQALVELCKLINDYSFEDLPHDEQAKARQEFLYLLQKQFFNLWF